MSKEKRITWDPNKNRINKRKHRIVFKEAATVLYDRLSVTVNDAEHSIDERRFHIIGESNRGRLMVVSFAETEDEIRLISAQSRRNKKEGIMKKDTPKRRKSIDFSKGIRGKYAGMNLKIVGPAIEDEQDAKAVLKKVSRVLNSAGTSKREMEVAIERVRNLIASSGSPNR